MPDAQPSLVQQSIWARTERPEPREERYDFATYALGVDRRDCLMCNATTTRPDSICARHDYMFGRALWRRQSDICDFAQGRKAEVQAEVDAWYRERGYGT